jgi:hypothetical protein
MSGRFLGRRAFAVLAQGAASRAEARGLSGDYSRPSTGGRSRDSYAHASTSRSICSGVARADGETRTPDPFITSSRSDLLDAPTALSDRASGSLSSCKKCRVRDKLRDKVVPGVEPRNSSVPDALVGPATPRMRNAVPADAGGRMTPIAVASRSLLPWHETGQGVRRRFRARSLTRYWRIRGLLDRAARALPSCWRGHPLTAPAWLSVVRMQSSRRARHAPQVTVGLRAEQPPRGIAASPSRGPGAAGVEPCG